MDIHEFLQTAGEAAYVALSAVKNAAVFVFGHFMDWVNVKTAQVKLPMMPTMMKLFSNASVNRWIFYLAAGYIAVMNITAFAMFGRDKFSAKKKKRRISEKALMRVCVLGGAMGGLIGMSAFRHKTKHKKFSAVLPILFILQLILDSFLIGFLGFWAFF